MAVDIPAGLLARASRGPDWAGWLERLPRLVNEVCSDWGLRPDGPGRHGECAFVLPVRRCDRSVAVAKFGWPHAEAAYEHLALRDWNGRGAVRLLRADPHRSVLLLERADAGRDLHALPVLEACAVAAGLYRVLHRPALPQLDRLSVHLNDWAGRMHQIAGSGLVPRRLVAQASALARDLAGEPAIDDTLLHGDLHYANVLASAREATLPTGEREANGLADQPQWLAIDPKPLAGDPAYEVSPLLRNRWDEVLAADWARDAILDRFATVADVAGLDEDRARACVLVREMVNIVWAIEDAERGHSLDRAEITVATTIIKAVQR